MCLIAVAGAGTQKYSEFFLNAVRKGAESNTDGLGYSFKRAANNNRIWISKGFTDVEALISCLKNKRLKDGDELMVHSRIGNKGAKNSDMTHPFVISNDHDTILSNNEYVTLPTMCHNGTFFSYSETNSIFSDSYFFAKKFMSVPEFQALLKRDIELFKDVFKNTLGSNRLSFLFPGETPMIRLGDWKEDQGYYFSNDTYKQSKYRNVGGEIDYEYENYQRRYGHPRYNRETIPDRTASTSPIQIPERTTAETTNSRIREAVNEATKWKEDKEQLENSLKKIGTRVRNINGSLEANPQFDIIPAIGSNTIITALGKLRMHAAFGKKIYVPLEYKVSQFKNACFIPQEFNYKHFRLRALVTSTEMNVSAGTLYHIDEFNPEGVAHRINAVIATRAQYLKMDYAIVSDEELIKYFNFEYAPMCEAIYFDVFRLMQKFDGMSKNNLRQITKTIDQSERKNKILGIKFKKMTYLRLDALKIFHNYLVSNIIPKDQRKLLYYSLKSNGLENLVN